MSDKPKNIPERLRLKKALEYSIHFVTVLAIVLGLSGIILVGSEAGNKLWYFNLSLIGLYWFWYRPYDKD